MAVKCPKCNTKNPDDSKFCKECASPLGSSKDISITKTIQTHTRGFKKNTVIANKYKILEELGRGGMGVVYKAKDTRLKRTVALKFLPAELTKDKEAKKRFIQEAQAAAALDHPNICIVHEVDETDGQTFIAMSYIEGQSLKDKLEDGPMDVDEVKDIALQVAEGLKEAHEKGIVHRDIKPANIMLTEKGQVKITDFGLAKLSWGVDLTKTSTIMGTVAYMSPEQAKGEEVDHRTDIWSLGAMLYEMLTNGRPFKKDKEHALIHEIINEEPEPITSLRPDIPRHIEEVVHKALAKDVGSRLQTMNDLIQNLKQSLPIILPKAECSIVVLPFEDMSPDKDNEYFSDGLTEEIITDLSQIHELCVISRNSAMALKGTRKNTKTIGRELNIQYVLEGSVRKAGNNLRITAQLIDARNDVHLWAKKYSGTMDDVFDIQEKVSRSIVDALKLKLTPEEKQKMAARKIDDTLAYECYFRARQELFKYTEESLLRALKYLENGLEIVGEHTLLYAGMGEVYFQFYDSGIRVDELYLNKAKEYADKILNLDPDSSHGHLLLGLLLLKRESALKAYPELKRALNLDPNNPANLNWLGYITMAHIGRLSVAEPLVERLQKIDPLTPFVQSFHSFMHWMKGRFDLARESLQKWIQMEPDGVLSHWYYLQLLAWEGKFDEASVYVDKYVQEFSHSSFTSLSLFLKFSLEGKKSQARESISKEVLEVAWNDFHLPWYIAECYSLLDEKQEALKWLEHAVDRGWINYPLFSELDPFLENIRKEPRFKKLMERVKHEWENFEL
jgi:non-specific serine/threonine protein kinase